MIRKYLICEINHARFVTRAILYKLKALCASIVGVNR